MHFIPHNLLDIDFSLPFRDSVLIFSVVLFIVLLAPLLLRKIRIPSIIGLIIAGVAIGPHGFNIISDESIELFGNVGLLYIMFTAGLELDLNEFKRNKNKSLTFGFFTFIFPFLIGIITCHFVLNFSYMSSILVSSMFSTHTLVAYPIASKLGISKDQAVTVAVGGTIITDTVVLLILAVITGATEGEITAAFWWQLGISFAIFLGIIFFLFPLLGRWFFKNIRTDNATEYIFVLGMVFLAAFLAELAGIDAIIGAFMAGLALNSLIPHTSPIMNRIEFVGNALFIPFFLIGVGMLVDLRVLTHGPEALFVAGVLLVAAFSGKWIGAFITQKVFKYTKTERNVVFGLTSAHAAATLAVILVGHRIGLVDSHTLNGTVILILVSSLVSSFVTESAGRKLAIQQSEVAPKEKNKSERFLVPISNPKTIGKLIDFAVMIKDRDSSEPIYSLTVVHDNEKAEDYVNKGKKMQEDVEKHASGSDNRVRRITRIDLSAVGGITKTTKESGITDLVMGWSNRNSTLNRLFGSKMDSVQNNIWKNIYVCHFIHPINTAKRMIVVFPEYAEYEVGFTHIVRKLNILALEAGVIVEVFCTEKTQEVFAAIMEEMKSSVSVKYHSIKQLHEIEEIEDMINKNDLLIIISARRRTVAHESYLDSIPLRLNRHFSDYNFILIFPEQITPYQNESSLYPNDINLEPIKEQLKNFSKVGRALNKMVHPPKKPAPAPSKGKEGNEDQDQDKNGASSESDR